MRQNLIEYRKVNFTYLVFYIAIAIDFFCSLQS